MREGGPPWNPNREQGIPIRDECHARLLIWRSRFRGRHGFTQPQSETQQRTLVTKLCLNSSDLRSLTPVMDSAEKGIRVLLGHH